MGLRLSNEHNIWSMAELEIYNTWGDKVSFEQKAKTLKKYGETTNADSGTKTTVMQQLDNTVINETYSTTNDIDTITTSDTNATGQVRVEGHTISSGILTFVAQLATLDGFNKVVLTTPLARLNRIRKVVVGEVVGGVAATSATSIANGNRIFGFVDDSVTLTSGVPDTAHAAKVKAVMNTTEGTTLKAATSISNADYYLITKLTAHVSRQNAGTVQATIRLESKEVGGDFITRNKEGISNNAPLDADTFFIIKKNSDVRITAVSDTDNAIIDASMFGWLAQVTEAAA